MFMLSAKSRVRLAALMSSDESENDELKSVFRRVTGGAWAWTWTEVRKEADASEMAKSLSTLEYDIVNVLADHKSPCKMGGFEGSMLSISS